MLGKQNKQGILTNWRHDPHQAQGGHGGNSEEQHSFPPPASLPQPSAQDSTMPNTLTQTGSIQGAPNIQPRFLSIGSGVRLKGAAIEDCDTLIVAGQVEASVDCHTLQIAPEGVYRGKASVDNAVITGLFEGELLVRERLALHTGGRVSGKLCYGSLLIEEGGAIEGEVSPLSTDQENRNPRTAESSVTRLAPSAAAEWSTRAVALFSESAETQAEPEAALEAETNS
jgi:cytoskeletal protein CcmA (bactofilin family)